MTLHAWLSNVAASPDACGSPTLLGFLGLATTLPSTLRQPPMHVRLLISRQVGDQVRLEVSLLGCCRCHRLAGLERRSRRRLDDARALDTQHAGERHSGRMAEPRVKLPQDRYYWDSQRGLNRYCHSD